MGELRARERSLVLRNSFEREGILGEGAVGSVMKVEVGLSVGCVGIFQSVDETCRVFSNSTTLSLNL